MKTLTKEKKVKFIQEITLKHNITAYTIAKNTNITEAGIKRVINGSSQNPHLNTVNGIYNYLMELYPVSDKMDGMELKNTLTGVKSSLANEDGNRYGAEITDKIGLLLENLITRIVNEQTAPEFKKVNENILSLFKNQMELNRIKPDTDIKPLSANNGTE